MLSEISQSQTANTVQLHLFEVPSIVGVIQTESTIGLPAAGRGEDGDRLLGIIHPLYMVVMVTQHRECTNATQLYTSKWLKWWTSC